MASAAIGPWYEENMAAVAPLDKRGQNHAQVESGRQTFQTCFERDMRYYRVVELRAGVLYAGPWRTEDGTLA